MKNKFNNSPLHQAIRQNKIQAVKYLMELCSFDLEEKGENEMNIIELSIMCSNIVTINLYYPRIFFSFIFFIIHRSVFLSFYLN